MTQHGHSAPPPGARASADPAARAAALFCVKGVVAGAADPRAPAAGLWPAEAEAMRRVADRRLRDFAAGRAAARQALERLGLPRQVIGVGRHGVPVWPRGVTGSISHCDSACVAVLAPADALRGLGVDVEPCLPLPPDIVETVCRPEECDWLASLPAGSRGVMARVVFAIKEAVFKTQFPLTGIWLGFQDVALRLDPAAGRYAARILCDAGALPAGQMLEGRFDAGPGLVAGGFAGVAGQGTDGGRTGDGGAGDGGAGAPGPAPEAVGRGLILAGAVLL